MLYVTGIHGEDSVTPLPVCQSTHQPSTYSSTYPQP